MIQEKQIVIKDQEKESNPILKVVYNKVRNLNKKIAQIQHIKTLDPKSLKIAQVNKLNKLDEIVQEIQKQEEFAITYKTILVQNNLVYEKVDDLLKISTLLAVGKRIGAQEYCPEESKKVYTAFYQPIFKEKKGISKSQMPNEVIRIYQILWKYLDRQENYSECRDYLTYLHEIDERKKILKAQEPQIIHKQNVNNQIKLNAYKARQVSLSINSEVFKINLTSFENQMEKYAFLQKDSSSQSSIPMAEYPMRKELSEDLETKHSNEDITLIHKEELNHFQMEMEIQESTTLEQKIQQKEEQGTGEPEIQIHPPSGQNKTQKKTNKNKRHRKNIRHNLQPQVDFNVRKCSDTSLQPTPQKCKGKKVRYMQKVI